MIRSCAFHAPFAVNHTPRYRKGSRAPIVVAKSDFAGDHAGVLIHGALAESFLSTFVAVYTVFFGL